MRRSLLRRRGHRKFLAAIMAVVYAFAAVGLGQSPRGNKSPSPGPGPVKPLYSGDQKSPSSPVDKSTAQSALSPEEVRKAQIVSDTQRLYRLALELQIEVAKSSKDTLSLSVIRKASEIEDLARNLKQRLKD